jgi:hypothetical protein
MFDWHRQVARRAGLRKPLGYGDAGSGQQSERARRHVTLQDQVASEQSALGNAGKDQRQGGLK